jgi:hypothetical protein
MGISARRKELTASLEERSSKLKKFDPLAQQQKQKDFLSKFKAASKRINVKKTEKVEEAKEAPIVKPKDFNSAINRTFTPSNVKYVNKENDPAYEMNQALLDYTHERQNAFKRQKIEIVNKNVLLDAEFKPLSDNLKDIDITKAAADVSGTKVEHPMDCEKLIFMNKLPITTNFDNQDIEVNLDITQLPARIEREKQRYKEAEEAKKQNIAHKAKTSQKGKSKGKEDLFDTGNIDKNIVDVDEAKLDMMFGKEDFK